MEKGEIEQYRVGAYIYLADNLSVTDINRDFLLSKKYHKIVKIYKDNGYISGILENQPDQDPYVFLIYDDVNLVFWKVYKKEEKIKNIYNNL